MSRRVRLTEGLDLNKLYLTSVLARQSAREFERLFHGLVFVARSQDCSVGVSTIPNNNLVDDVFDQTGIDADNANKLYAVSEECFHEIFEIRPHARPAMKHNFVSVGHVDEV